MHLKKLGIPNALHVQHVKNLLALAPFMLKMAILTVSKVELVFSFHLNITLCCFRLSPHVSSEMYQLRFSYRTW